MHASRNEPVLVVGEALVDLVRRPGEDPVARVGGSPLNVAVGLARLDVAATLATTIGTDLHGALVAEHLAVNGVALAAGSVVPGATSTAVATLDERGTASYAFDLHWAPVAVTTGAPALVHVGSIGAVLEAGGPAVLETVDALRGTATISYDPNIRPGLMGDPASARARVESLVARADVVKASDEDVAWLYPGTDPEAVVRRWSGLGPAIVAVTHGGAGAVAVAPAASARVDAAPTRIVDTIGAGDSFMAGLLAALADRGLLGREATPRLRSIDDTVLREVLDFAAGCAAVTVARLGADPPRRAELATRTG